LIGGGLLAAIAAPAWSAPLFDIHQTPMSQALTELAREAGVEILFDPRVVQNLKAKPVRGELSVDAALTQLLEGSGVGFRTTADGAIVLFAQPVGQASEGDVVTISEILVTGRRTQNADIRRTPNDVQPYAVWDHSAIETAHRDSLDQFLRSYAPANTQIRPPSEDLVGLSGSTRSAVDLRGFGTGSTLVLVDGRRLPHIPSPQGEFTQPDLNGLPQGAVERIETLTSTAGGIYGPSAIGGVVNVVLRREYRGAELNVTSGLSDRGDAGQVRIEARLGFTPDQGQTDVMLFASRAASQPLRLGRRDYLQRAQAREFANDPASYLARIPTGDGVSVYSLGGPLILQPQFGGAQLSATFTYLPINFGGTAADRAAALAANSGKLAPGLPDDRSGARRYVAANPTVTSVLINIRRRLGDHAELYLDGLYFEDAGRLETATDFNFIPTAQGAPGNPFSQKVVLAFPLPQQRDVAINTARTGRLTAGFIAGLPFRDWKATGDITIGLATDSLSSLAFMPTGAFLSAIAKGTPGSGGLPAVSPLGDWPTFLAASSAYFSQQELTARLTNRFSDASLRLGGPLTHLPGGDLTATLLLETRRERVTASPVTGAPFPLVLPQRTQAVQSGYAEFRAPLGPPDAGNVFLRGLELQFAARYDRTITTLPDNGTAAAPSNDRLISLQRDATAFTVGARAFPTPALMLRASLATGDLPPTISQFQTSSFVTNDSHGAVDPLRGNEPLGRGGTYVLLSGGSHTVKQALARTVTLGVVLNPSGLLGPRLSVDYSRTVETNAITTLTQAQLLAAEVVFPGRVVRAPLTPADASLGFTGGQVIQLDTEVINSGRSVVDAVDLQLDWSLPAGRAGVLRVHGAATWEPDFRQQAARTLPTLNLVGHIDGPLVWRGNLGIEWTMRTLAVDLDAQYFDSYRVTHADPANPTNVQLLSFQGEARVPSQIYVDLAARRRFALWGGDGQFRTLEVRLGVENLFDRSPPIVADIGALGYSPYGDPRRRRVELTLSAQF
jgi:outer membrane receptor protein involved in Fe transport